MNLTTAVLFDLDGTLLDTAGDLGLALNHLLTAHQKPTIPLALIRPSAGRGCRGLLKMGFDIDDTHTQYPALCEQLLNFYQNHVADTTRLFAGMEEVLTQLESLHIPWGIVTNKPKKYTHLLLDQLKLSDRAHCIISGDTLTKCKPHPDPILHACQLMQKNPENCLYIGDSEIDIIASKAARTKSIAALYGYIPAEEDPSRWNADAYIKNPIDILKWLAIQC